MPESPHQMREQLMSMVEYHPAELELDFIQIWLEEKIFFKRNNFRAKQKKKLLNKYSGKTVNLQRHRWLYKRTSRTLFIRMYMRLAFSVAIHCKPEILIVDEILAVGDAPFQEKCFNKWNNLKKMGSLLYLCRMQ